MLPLSALQHLLFCERQCALIHLEQVWAENRLTVEGTILHERAHDGPDESRPGVRIARGLPVVSQRLQLSGQADIVEFHRLGEIIPVEYKRGKPKADLSDRVQLCAQAICLEEMFDTDIPHGFLFYGKRQHRTKVLFDLELRMAIEESAQRLHELIASRLTPAAEWAPKCESCSLERICLPRATRFKTGAAKWLERQLAIDPADSEQSDRGEIVPS